MMPLVDTAIADPIKQPGYVYIVPFTAYSLWGPVHTLGNPRIRNVTVPVGLLLRLKLVQKIIL